MSAKLMDADGNSYEITLNSAHTVEDERVLLERERRAAISKYGKLTPALHANKALFATGDRVSVSIWLNFPMEFPRKEDLLADARKMAAHEANLDARLSQAAARVNALLANHKVTVTEDGSTGPLIRATIPVEVLPQIEALPEVGSIRLDDPVGRGTSCGDTNTCTTWKGTMRLADAHKYFSTGSSEKICVKEGGQPDSYARLSRVLLASPSGPVDPHIRGTIGTIKNTDTVGPPYNSVAPSSSIYIANWGNFTATGGVDKWCRDNSVRYMNFSWTFSDGSPGGQSNADMWHDWMAKRRPYILVVASAGNNGDPACPNCVVQNRGYNGLVVGGMNDHETTSISDDTYDPYTGWKNFTTPHNDYELPNVVAPSYGNSVTENYTHNASSAATPMVTGVAALAGARDPATFDDWPEMKRAVVMATATQRMDQGFIARLPLSGGDGHVGAGSVDAFQAAQLGEPSAWTAPNSTSNIRGRYGLTLDFNTDFDAATRYSTKRWEAHIPGSGSGRLRVVIAWDASPTCGSLGETCTRGALDGDIDLYVWKTSSSGFSIPPGVPTCTSTSYDSSYEICDFPAVGGENYVIVPKKITSNASNTYFGIAWYYY